MKSIDEIQDEIIEEFSVFDDWMDKYAKVARAGYGCRPIIERVPFILKRRAMRLS